MTTPSEPSPPEKVDQPAGAPKPAAPPPGPTPVPKKGPVAGVDNSPHYTPVPGAKKYKNVGDYEILSKLGQGAMGSVYLAKQISSGRKVALKILPPDLAKDQELLERFKREARASQRVQHPNIVSAVDFGTVDKYHYIAMEYVDGPDLETMLKKNGIFKDEMVMRVATEMCAAFAEIERLGIVHRDIKPSNILMSSQGIFRLTDLGLASASMDDQRLTLAGFAVGTPYYLSPEQARGQLDVDVRADIYGLGATLYHLATGGVPFPGSNPVLVMTQHISTPLKPPCEVNPALSKSIGRLIEQLMQKSAEDRPQNTSQLRMLIEQCRAGQLPGARAALRTPDEPTVRMDKKKAAAATRSSDGVQSTLDTVLGFLPQKLRMPIAIGALVLACLAVVTAIVVMVIMKK